MSVSVLVNDAAAGKTGWTEPRLASLGDMVRTATGFNAERGDKFNISSFQFVETDIAGSTDTTPWWQLPIMREYARYLFGTLIALALIFFGVRPLVSHLVKGKRHNSELSPQLLAQQQGSDGKLDDFDALASDKTAVTESANSIDKKVAEDEMPTMALPKAGALFEEQVAHMQYLAHKESDRVTAVIKTWVERGIEIESSKS
jgi:flagellar M-ring protein FliF